MSSRSLKITLELRTETTDWIVGLGLAGVRRYTERYRGQNITVRVHDEVV